MSADDAKKLQSLQSVDQPKEFEFCKKKIQERNLPMKLASVEHLLGGSKIIFYFLAEGRVDFRELVKDLAQEYHTRIEMRQIGVRDEARLLADYEHCGRELCCKTFIKNLEPVTMKMAKNQKATLDPTKISGRCGRLMCCLRFEDSVYEDLRSGLPGMGVRVATAEGEGEVVAQDAGAEARSRSRSRTSGRWSCLWRRSRPSARAKPPGRRRNRGRSPRRTGRAEWSSAASRKERRAMPHPPARRARMSRPSFYLTTPIYYVTDPPHIGTSYTTIAADILARYKRQCGYDVHFLTGTDEHGLKVQRAAQAKGIAPRELADQRRRRAITARGSGWKSRTTISSGPRRSATSASSSSSSSAGANPATCTWDKYDGWYCVSCESFLKETEEAAPKCPDCGRPAEWNSEASYFFRLSRYQDRLLKLYEEQPDFVRPAARDERTSRARRRRNPRPERHPHDARMGRPAPVRPGAPLLRLD